MSANGRLYKAEWVTDDNGEVVVDTNERAWVPAGLHHLEPAGWREYALEQWPDGPREGEHWPNGHKPFFWPSTDRIFRSRSAAQRRVDIINRWGGRAVLVECTPRWMTVSAANAVRKSARLFEKRARVMAELEAVEADLRAVERLRRELV